MIDVKIEDLTIVEERGIEGSGLQLMTEVVTMAAYVLDYAAKDEVSYAVLRDALAETIERLEFGNMREGKQSE